MQGLSIETIWACTFHGGRFIRGTRYRDCGSIGNFTDPSYNTREILLFFFIYLLRTIFTSYGRSRYECSPGLKYRDG